MKIFDSHIHIQPWTELRQGAYKILRGERNDEEAAKVRRIMDEPTALKEFLDSEGVEKACIINYVAAEVMGFSENANEYAVKVAQAMPGRIVPYGGINPIETKDPAGAMKQAIELGIRGLKIHPSHQLVKPNAYRDGLKSLEQVYRLCSDNKVVLMIHTGTSIFPSARNMYSYPLYAEDIGIDFPDLRVILAHGGRPLWMKEAFFLLRRFKNWYLDISSIPPKSVPEYFPRLEEIGDRVLFGSDWPAPGVKSPARNAKMVAELPLKQELLSNILYNNANKLYFGN